MSKRLDVADAVADEALDWARAAGDEWEMAAASRGKAATDFATRATPLARKLNTEFERMINSGNLGLAALLTGETDTASHAFREELALCRDLVVGIAVGEGLSGLAAVAVVDGDDERAARLVGAADAHRYDRPEDAVDARLKRCSSGPPAHDAERTHGMRPRAQAAR
jgi:hypothetical protein